MIQLSVPEMQVQLRPRITVFGVGGAGGNAVNNMIRAALEGVEFVVANSDSQSLQANLAERKLQLGVNLTRGLGAGAKPEVGRAAAEEQIDEITAYLEGANMAFITAGMGGGTGTGAAPVIARAAREQGILTVGVVTKPFHFEGSHRMRMAEAGIAELHQYVDTLIIIPNQNLFRIANERTTFADAFRLADEVLHSGVRGVTDLMVMPGLINLDFADIRSVMSEMGKAMMGTGEATGEKRAILAAEAAIANPLLDDVSMKGARGVLINITGGYDMTLFEVDEAANRIREEVDPDANIIFGSTFDEKVEGRMRVSVVATGIDMASMEYARSAGKAALAAGGTAQAAASGVPPTAQRGAEAKIAPEQQALNTQRNAGMFSPGFLSPAKNQTTTPAQAAASHAASQHPAAAVSAPAPSVSPSAWNSGVKPASTAAQQQANAQANADAGEGGAVALGQQKKPGDSLNHAATAQPGVYPGAYQSLAQQTAQPNSGQQESGQDGGAGRAAMQGASPRQAVASQPNQKNNAAPQQQARQQGAVGPAAASAPPQPAAALKRSSLFARIVGGKREQEAVASPAATPAAQSRTTPPPPQTRLGTDSAESTNPVSEEETLAIPAFLRRQSN